MVSAVADLIVGIVQHVERPVRSMTLLDELVERVVGKFLVETCGLVVERKRAGRGGNAPRSVAGDALSPRGKRE